VAGFADGSTREVTSEATWTSADPNTATVSRTGLVTPVATGTTTINASYLGVTGSVAVAVLAPAAQAPPPPEPSPTFTLSGVVRATPLNETVAGVQIEATHDGRVVNSAMSDGGGRYSISGLIAQEYVIRLQKVGYYARGMDLLVSRDTTRDLVMDRNHVHLEGVVREAPPCSSAPIPNVLVQVLDGPDAGKSSLTDREGLRYGIADVAWGTFQVRASRDGYTSSELTLNVPPSNVVSGPLIQDFAVARTARQALFGEVRERRTEFGPRLADVRVEVISGPDAGRSTTSDSSGMYRLEQLAAGTPMVRATKAGYVNEVVTASLCGDFRRDIRMSPANARLEAR
jgi:hypothetical protein